MRLRLIKKQTVFDYYTKHPRSKSSFEIWLKLINSAEINEPTDFKKLFGSSDILGNGSDRIIFNVGGNNDRIIGKYYFGNKLVHLFIKWIGTHKEYTEICKSQAQYTIEKY